MYRWWVNKWDRVIVACAPHAAAEGPAVWGGGGPVWAVDKMSIAREWAEGDPMEWIAFQEAQGCEICSPVGALSA